MACGACGYKTTPKTMTVVKNAAQAAGRVALAFVRGQQVFSEDELVKKRLDACIKCDYYDKEKIKCKDCGCWLVEGPGGIPGKAKLVTEKCPIHKW